MKLSDLTQEDILFLKEYEITYRKLNLFIAIEDVLTLKGKEDKSKASKYLVDNLDRYMSITN